MSGKVVKRSSDGGKLRPSDWNRLTKQLVDLTAGAAAAASGKPKK